MMSRRFLRGPREVYAHCDIPCGIYDPHQAQIAALTVIRMMDLIADTKSEHDIARYIAVKEQHAELCKQEARIIWGDYFKADHTGSHPELNELTHEIMKLASVARQGVDRKDGVKLLEAINKFAEIFWETKGISTKRVKSPYKPEEEIVYPEL